MEDIIAPIDKEILKSELTPERRLRFTNKSHNEIYVVTAHNAPNVMKEVGRLREIAFRAAGGGTGKSMDIDEYDMMPHPYKQLIVWNPEAEEILGGYRYLFGDEVEYDEHGKPVLATAHMFDFSDYHTSCATSERGISSIGIFSFSFSSTMKMTSSFSIFSSASYESSP